MSEIKYAIITLADCIPSYRETAFELLSDFSNDLHSNANPAGVRYGYMGTGSDAGALVFTQLYGSLNDFDMALEVYSSSTSYKTLLDSGNVNVISRNIVKLLPIPFTPIQQGDAKYLVFTLASGQPGDREMVVGDMSQMAKIFSENGALTLRFGPLVTGSNAGDYLLGVSYPSMDAIEKTYDVLTKDPKYLIMVSRLDIKRREIMRLFS